MQNGQSQISGDQPAPTKTTSPTNDTLNDLTLNAEASKIGDWLTMNSISYLHSPLSNSEKALIKHVLIAQYKAEAVRQYDTQRQVEQPINKNTQKIMKALQGIDKNFDYSDVPETNCGDISENGSNTGQPRRDIADTPIEKPMHPVYRIGERAIADCFPNSDDENGIYHLDYGNLQALVFTVAELLQQREIPVVDAYPECSGDPKSCPENEGYGCCMPNPKEIRDIILAAVKSIQSNVEYPESKRIDAIANAISPYLQPPKREIVTQKKDID